MWRVLARLVLLLVAGVASATSITSVTVTNHSSPASNLIEADAVDGNNLSNRHQISVEVVVSYTVPTSGTHRLVVQLLDPADTVVYEQTEPSFVLAGTPIAPVTYTVNLTPGTANRLEPGQVHRVKAYLSKEIFPGSWSPVANGTESPGRRYYHFVGVDPDDTAVNTIAEVTGGTYGRTDLVGAGTTTNGKIPVDVEYTLRRYDKWNAAPASHAVSTRIECQLYDAGTNLPVTSTVTGATFDVTVPTHTLAHPPALYAPEVVTGTRTVQLNPGAQLASRSKQYYVVARIKHVEVPVGSRPPFVDGLPLNLATARFLHFNGSLDFGGVATSFTGLASAPAAPVLQSGYLTTTIAPTGGTLDIDPARVFTGTNLGVRLYDNGDAVLTSGSVQLSRPNPDMATAAGGIRWERSGAVSLGTAGASAKARLHLPVGLGWADGPKDGELLAYVDFGSIPLTPALDPAASEVVATGEKYFAEESKPVRLRVSALRWGTGTGRIDFDEQEAISIQAQMKAEIDQVAHLLKTQPMRSKRSNDNYHAAMNGTLSAMSVTAGSSGEARMSATYGIGMGTGTGHFPYGVIHEWSGGQVVVDDDAINVTASWLVATAPAAVPYARHRVAGTAGCGVGTPSALYMVTSTDGKWHFTPDGGLWCDGELAGNQANLAWGAAGNGKFVHQFTRSFGRGNLLLPGHFLRGGDGGDAPEDCGPGEMLLSGYDGITAAITERPHQATYRDGLADYAGLNLRADGLGIEAISHIAGTDYGPYTMKDRAKYYVRASGVSGIHDADESSIPSRPQLWGYQFEFATYGTGYLSNRNEVSRIQGQVVVPPPADVAFGFGQMRLSDTGALTTGPLADGPVTGRLAYWNAPFTARAIGFVTRDGCDPGAGGFLTVGLDLGMSHFAIPISGTLGLGPDGQILSPSDKVPGVDSRFPMPARLTIHGRMGKDYSFAPVLPAYLNRASEASGETYGFWNLFGRMDVPFFQDVLVHLHVRATAGDQVSPMHVMGGWPDYGWRPEDKSPFENADFDPIHRGFGDTSLAVYRAVDEPPDDTFRARARREWLGGMLNFDYALKWHPALRYFTAASPARNVDVIVAKAQHQVEYLGPDLAHITFGVQYDGLPRVNLANAFTNQLDEATGFASALSGAITEPLFDRLDSGLQDFTSMVTDQVDAYVIGMLDNQLNPVIDDFCDRLRDELQNGGDNARERAENIVRAFFTGGGDDPPLDTMKATVRKLGEGTAEANSLLGSVDARLAAVEDLIDKIIDGIPETEPPYTRVPGFLYTDDTGALATLQNVALEIVNILGMIFVAPTVEPEIKALIAEIEGPVEQIKEILLEVKAHVSGLRERLGEGGEMLTEVNGLLQSATVEFDAAVLHAQDEMLAYVALLGERDFAEIDGLRDEIKMRIRRDVMDALGATNVLRDVSDCVRDRVFDVREAFNGAMDSLFEEVNGVVRKALSTAVQAIDEKINGAIGSLGDSIGMGRVTGFAHINQDTLERLRLDALFQWKVPEEMEFEGFLDIKQRRSDGPASGCGPGNEDLYEVILGAMHVPVSWLGSDVKADVNAKFNILAMGNVPVPLGLGGAFEMKEGTLEFESAKITGLGAATMFSVRSDFSGIEEAYLAAHVRVAFSASELAGGVFFGRTCSLAPLEMVDPLVAEVLGQPPFTGAYVYGEGTFPLVDFGCVFNVSAGAGVGVFYFLEGPTYGGRMNAHVAGEALCVVSVRGDVDLVGVKRGSDYAFNGRGGLKGKVGVCPFCIKFNKKVDIKYQNEDWDVDY